VEVDSAPDSVIVPPAFAGFGDAEILGTGAAWTLTLTVTGPPDWPRLSVTSNEYVYVPAAVGAVISMLELPLE
jgi:hypothetical protein